MPVRFGGTRNGQRVRRAVVWWLTLAILVAVGIRALIQPPSAAAHPLGNFTINRYARVEPGADLVRVVYALDMAEIPSFQELSTIDRDRNGTVSDDEKAAYLAHKLPDLAGHLQLTVNGAPLRFRVESGTLSLGEGQGGLPLVRIDATFVAELPAGLGSVLDAWFRDTNYDARLGWKEIVVRGTGGAAVRESSVPPVNTSDELRSYPEDALQSPLDVREARFRFEPGVPGADDVQGAIIRAAGGARRAVGTGNLARFADAAATRRLTLPVALFLLVAAMFWGAVHALGPGHGKTVVAAYLVGSRGTARHALLLGLTVTATHTAGVYLLGLITLMASHLIVPERLYPLLSLASGLIVLSMGLALLVSRLRTAGLLPMLGHAHGQPGAPGHHHHHAGHHEHGHEQGHDHHHHHCLPGEDGRPVTWRGLLALGMFGGLIPCPTAIVVLLTSIALNRVAFGLLLVIAFSAGLAAVLVGIGLALVLAGRAVARVRVNGALVRAVPIVSAAAVLVAGLLITLRAAGVVLAAG